MLNLVPLSAFTDPSHKTFLTSSDSYRLCIDSNGNLRQDTSDTEEQPQNENENDYDDYKYTICTAEEDDLPPIATFIIDAFGGADVITLSNDLTSSFNALETSLLKPGINLWNNYANVVAFTDVLSGLRQRIQNRTRTGMNDNLDYMIEAPPALVRGERGEYSQKDVDDIAAKSSVVFVIARSKSKSKVMSKSRSDTNDIEVIASVELRLQPTDAKIPFSQPWFDKIERSIAQQFTSANDTNMNTDHKSNSKILQPYLSNLCVDHKVRGRGIGKVLCRIIECTVRDSWEMDSIYLHVDLDNTPALNLYKSEGYTDVGARWNPFWAGSSSEIGYFVKNL